MRSLLVIILTALIGPMAYAGLKDDKTVSQEQKQLAQNLPATVVVRVHDQTKKIQVRPTKEALPANQQAVQQIADQDFRDMQASDRVSGEELDRDSSTSSWFFYFYNWNPYLPTFYYGGYNFNYAPYYTYNYAPFTYYFYRWW